jgi:hypothetical protein
LRVNQCFDRWSLSVVELPTNDVLRFMDCFVPTNDEIA